MTATRVIVRSRPGRHIERLVQRTVGVTLIELMVALAIGSFLLLGAVTVFVQSRMTFRVTESVSRLQENARFAVDMLEPDVRMAWYFGLTSQAERIGGRATALEPVPTGLAVANDCGQNWTIDITAGVAGANNNYDWACAPFGGSAQAGSDTLVIRRAAQAPIAAPAAGTLHVQSARFEDGALFVGPAIPAGFDPASTQTHRLVVNGYYVSPTSSLSTPGNLVPSLRMKTLQGGTSGPRIVDQEVLPGVEDLQVQFGVDTDAPGMPGRGAVNRFVNPADPLLDPANAAFDPDARVLAVRVWLRVRAEQPEVGFTDETTYQYADRVVPPPMDRFRRMLVSKTIYLRNARAPI
jgi:type IV pilus assembly protein PilW